MGRLGWVVCQLALVALLGTQQAQAGDTFKPMTAQCLAQSAQRHGVLPIELLMILYVERGATGYSTPNTNRTYDIGLFQINSIHLERLKSFGYTEQQLRNDGCLNVEFAAWYLSQVAPMHLLAQAQSEDEYFSILANYHSRTPKYNKRYAEMLKQAFYKIQGGA